MSLAGNEEGSAVAYLGTFGAKLPMGVEYIITKAKPITILLGRNGSGKSPLLRAVRDANRDDAIYIPPERGGELIAGIGQPDRPFDAAQRAGMTTNDTEPSYRRYASRGLREYYLTLTDAVARGSEVAVRPQELERLVEPLLTGFRLRIMPDPPHFSLTRDESDAPIVDTTPLSSGEVEVLTMALDIVALAARWDIRKKERRILLVDEPDVHIHADLQCRVAQFLASTARRFRLQLVVSTHSPSMAAALGQFGGDEIGIAYLRPRRGKSEIRVCAMSRKQREMATILGGHVLMGPLFGAPLLLVEGDDDYKIWSQVPRHHEVNVAVIPCNGEEIKNCQPILEAMFSALMEGNGPVGYVLLDHDKSPTEPSAANPQNFMKYVQLACHESENLYLTDEVLKTLGHDWKSACAKLAKQANEHGKKAEKLAGAAEWERKTADIKDCIREVSLILDDKRVDWALRVGKCIGRERPKGQLAEFLGEHLIQALWGRGGGGTGRSQRTRSRRATI